MSMNLSKSERKKAVRALNKIKRELEELLDGKTKSSVANRQLNYTTNFCPVITKTQIQFLAENVIGRKLEKEELRLVVRESYVRQWEKPLIEIVREVMHEKIPNGS